MKPNKNFAKMTKAVKIQGVEAKVTIEMANGRNHIELPKADNVAWHGTYDFDFIINGTTYQIQQLWFKKKNVNRPTVNLIYKGQKFADNQTKLAEYILNNN